MKGACGLLLLALAACEIEKTTIPRTDGLVAVHAVLSASAPEQTFLLERTRTGSVAIFAPPFDLEDPVVSDHGIAETDAIVQLTTPGGQTLAAIEDKLVHNGKGEGIYRVALPGASLVRGGVYTLSVRTSKGEILAAETVVPGGTAAMAAEALTFDRASDTTVLEWPASPGARAYFVRIETPFGPRSFFTDSTRVRLTGALRNTDLQDLPHVFLPGFQQAVTVSAVDSNYYDWYRSHNDLLSGEGLVNRVRGGLGVFGSLVRLRFQDLAVVAPQTTPGTGRYEFLGTPFERSVTPYYWIELYEESHAARADQPDALSGRLQKRPILGDPGCQLCGVLGTKRGTQIELSVLEGWYAKDTIQLFSGELHGDTLIGTYHGFGGIVHFLKKRP